jgi:UMP-CMP kinase 2
MIVAVEGLDGSGKTTVARSLADMLDAVCIALPPPELRLADNSVLEKHDSLARYLYYLSGVALLIEAAKQRDLIVADRFIASAHALHIHVRGKEATALRHLAFPRADLTLYLHVSEDERRKRLASRGSPLDPFEKKLNEDDRFREEVAVRLQAYPATHVIDTTGLPPMAVAEYARDLWQAASQ